MLLKTTHKLPKLLVQHLANCSLRANPVSGQGSRPEGIRCTGNRHPGKKSFGNFPVFIIRLGVCLSMSGIGLVYAALSPAKVEWSKMYLWNLIASMYI